MGGLQAITLTAPLATNPAAGLAGARTVQGVLRPTVARAVFLSAVQRGDARAIRFIRREMAHMARRWDTAIHVTRFADFDPAKVREILAQPSGGGLVPGQILVVESMSDPNTPLTTTRPTRHGINGLVNGDKVTTVIVSGETTPPNGTRVLTTSNGRVSSTRSLAAASEGARNSTPPSRTPTPPPLPPSDVKPEQRAAVFGEALAHSMKLFWTVAVDARKAPLTERDAMNALIILDHIGEATRGWGLKSAFERGFFVNEWAQGTMPQRFRKVSFIEGVTAQARILMFLNELKRSHPDFVANHFGLLLANTQEDFAQNLSTALVALEDPATASAIQATVEQAAQRLARFEAAAESVR